MVRIGVILAAAVAAAGCSALPATSGTRTEIDHEQVARIEQLARQRGVTVVWIQYPTKRVSEDAPK